LFSSPAPARSSPGSVFDTRDTIVFIIAIRPFEARDLPGILRIEEESFEAEAWPREAFLAYSAPDLFLVARVDGKIAGYIIASPTRFGASIESLAVRTRYRGRGVGATLMKTALKVLRRHRVKAVWLMVRRKNERAIRLYRGFGFERTATVQNHYKDGSTGWRMKLTLR
jgi:[ribosomal protein S18]-alanine N-acetyltransferase